MNEKLEQLMPRIIWLKEQDIKYEYGVTGLILGTLALSLQYSPRMGNICPWILILSWVLLFFAGIFSGIRLTAYISFLRLDELKSVGREIKDDPSMALINKFHSDTEKRVKKYFKPRWFAYMSGLFFNIIFSAINYLYPIYHPVINQ